MVVVEFQLCVVKSGFVVSDDGDGHSATPRETRQDSGQDDM